MSSSEGGSAGGVPVREGPSSCSNVLARAACAATMGPSRIAEGAVDGRVEERLVPNAGGPSRTTAGAGGVLLRGGGAAVGGAAGASTPGGSEGVGMEAHAGACAG